MQRCPHCLSPHADSDRVCRIDATPLDGRDPVVGAVLAGRYRVEECVGVASRGAVYRAVNTVLGHTTAVKVLHRYPDVDSMRLVTHDLGLLAAAGHPAIVLPVDAGEGPGATMYLVSEFIAGETLSAELRRRGPLRWSEAAPLVRQLCDALQTMHSAGVFHRAVHPGNVFLDRRRVNGAEVRLSDAGLARLSTFDPGNIPDWSAWAAPEVAQGEDVDARADVYAVAAVVYSMLTGSAPAVADRETPKLPPWVSLPAREVLVRAVSTDPADRFASVVEFGEHLAEFNETGPSWAIARLKPERTRTRSPAGPHSKPPRTNVPHYLTGFVGSDRLVDDAIRCLDEHRILSLTGPPGSGKSRLAIQIATEAIGEYPEGVWYVDLAAMDAPEHVTVALASVLRIQEESRQVDIVAIASALQFQKVLLIVDNCEHLLAATAAAVRALTGACPGVRVLAASREALGIDSETAWFVPLLSAEATGAAGERTSFSESDAIRLFVERASSVSPTFRLDATTIDPVTRICRLLGGLPLAIELAAAQIGQTEVNEVAETIELRFRTEDSMPLSRQQVLVVTLDWAYGRLEARTRDVLARLSVFAGGCSIDALAAVCGTTVEHEIESLTIRGLVASDAGGGVRYRLLDSVRQFASEALRRGANAASSRTAHRDYFLALAEKAEPELRGPDQVKWLERLELDHANLRIALEWSKTDARHGSALLRLASSLYMFWYVRGYFDEGLMWLRSALLTSENAPAGDRAKALAAAGALARVCRDYGLARTYFDEALNLFESIGDASGTARSLNGLGLVRQWEGDIAGAHLAHERALSVAMGAGDIREEASALTHLGVIARYRGDYATAEEKLGASLDRFRKLGDIRECASKLNNLGVVAAVAGNLDRANELLSEHLVQRRALGETRGVATAINNLGEVLRLRGDFEGAERMLAEAATLYLQAGDARGVAYSLEGFASLAAAVQADSRALRLLGAAEVIREASATPLAPAEVEEIERQLAPARVRLGARETARAMAAGRGLSIRQAVDYAVDAATSRR